MWAKRVRECDRHVKTPKTLAGAASSEQPAVSSQRRDYTTRPDSAGLLVALEELDRKTSEN